MWQMMAVTGVAAAAAAVALTYRRRQYRRVMNKAKAKKLAELSAAGFVFSKEYDLGSVTLLVDKPHKQWVLLDDCSPTEAKARPFDAIGDASIICHQKVHAGLRSPIGAGAVRRNVAGTNRVVNVTDSLRGVEIGLIGEESGQVLFINTLDGDYSAERVQAIVESLREQAHAGEPFSEENV